MGDGSEWPRISVVTPSFNQADFIEETIRSVLLQGYPNLEFMVIDGGSTDGSVDIIRKYEKWMAFWVSEKDRGQSHAINKGFERATGSVFGWLNSDDLYLPGALRHVIGLRAQQPDAPAWAFAANEVDERGVLIKTRWPHPGTVDTMGDWGCWGWSGDTHFHQPACFFDAGAFRRAGGVDERFYVALDVDLWTKLVKEGAFASSNEAVACARVHSRMKTLADPLSNGVEVLAVNVNRGHGNLARQRLERYMAFAVDQRLRNMRAADFLQYIDACRMVDLLPPAELLQCVVSRMARGFRRVIGLGRHK